MKIISVDYGDSRTGIAICGESEMLASPLTVITEYNFERCAQKVAELAKSENAGLIVVGYPKNMNNTIGERAEKCAEFSRRVSELSGIPAELWDERSTTVTAHNYLNETNVRGKKRKAVVDAVAATIILETYLAYRKNRRV
ncbi:MAG: Holliday junction resolvase RuvX [Ruminococcus sp.]|nr:Holliday junction resolvase RuvX [Ruminococcus sp.]MCM1479345.1 Holliday junction resolvase RuvX [Muribaculaceae bacterium]